MNSSNTHNKNEAITHLNQAINRDDDIGARGELCKVHDYDGTMVYLKNAKIWYNNDGNYVEPKIFKHNFCDTVLEKIKQLFCIHIE